MINFAKAKLIVIVHYHKLIIRDLRMNLQFEKAHWSFKSIAGPNNELKTLISDLCAYEI